MLLTPLFCLQRKNRDTCYNRNAPFFRRKSWLHYPILSFYGYPMCSNKIFIKLFQNKLLTQLFGLQRKNWDMCKKSEYTIFQKKVLATLSLIRFLREGKPMFLNKIFKKLFQNKLLTPLFGLQRQNGDMCQKTEYTIFQKKVLATLPLIRFLRENLCVRTKFA